MAPALNSAGMLSSGSHYQCICGGNVAERLGRGICILVVPVKALHPASHWICSQFPPSLPLWLQLYIVNWSVTSQLGFLNSMFIDTLCLF